MKIVIPGGSGQVGQVLLEHLSDKGHELVILTRHPENYFPTDHVKYARWDGKTLGDWVEEINGSDAVINLAGKNVNCRYNDENREEIMRSRVDSTTAVGAAIKKVENPPSVWLQASTATIYRHSFERPNDEFEGVIGGGEENAPRKWDFSVEVAETWEKTADQECPDGVRLVKMRTSLVMDPNEGGIFHTLANLVRFGLGGRAGSGDQYVSWLHYHDFCSIVEMLLTSDDVEGVVNVTSPSPLPFKDFMKAFREAYGRSIGLPATKWMLEIGAFFMRSETELILKSRWVIPGKLSKLEFEFKYPNWENAVENLVEAWKNR